MATRQRQVFPRETVAHLWAHQAQESARDSGGNFYYSGRTIYSYGSHFVIAHILSEECGPEMAGRVLWNDATYSSTTSTHQSIARQALTRQQRETLLRMPASVGMGRNVDPHGIDKALQEKRLPDVTQLVLARVIECIAGLPAKKRDGGPFALLLHEARKGEKLATLFYARAGRKYPLPLIPAELPADKPGLLAWVKTYAQTKMRADYAAEIKSAQHYAAQAQENAAQGLPGFPYFQHAPGCEWEARSVLNSTYDSAQRSLMHAGKAIALYATLHGAGKKPAAMVKLEKEIKPLAALFEARRDEFTAAEKRKRVIYAIREAAKIHHAAKARGVIHAAQFARAYRDAETIAQRAQECGLSDPIYLTMAARLSRVGCAVTAHHELIRVADDVESARSYATPGKHWADAKRCARDALRRLAFVRSLHVAPALAARMAPWIETLQAQADAIDAQAQAQIVAREADRLRAWLAGESNVRPSYEAGTYARIVESRGIVETTRGATVPIEHACRLARMYAIGVRRGGQEWKDGAGPMVGHYRVNKIGADGALVIGCHEFTPAEAKRLQGLLESCAACAAVAA